MTADSGAKRTPQASNALSSAIAGRCSRTAWSEPYGTAGAVESYDFSGKTDPQIARELLSDAGLDDVVVEAGLGALWDRYIGELESGFISDPMRLLPGVASLNEALDA